MVQRYTKLSNVPKNLASLKEWRRRGYRIITGKKINTSARLQQWNGMYYLNYRLYGWEDVCSIRGKKAKIRRVNFCIEFLSDGKEVPEWLRK